MIYQNKIIHGFLNFEKHASNQKKIINCEFRNLCFKITHASNKEKLHKLRITKIMLQMYLLECIFSSVNQHRLSVVNQ